MTGRRIGDGGTNAGLEILKGNASPEDQCYINTLPNGHILRTTSKYFRDEYGKVNGSLCINLDITDFINCEAALQSVTNLGRKSNESNSEIFIGNVDDMLTKMMTDAVESTGKSLNELTKEDKVQIVHELDYKGFFLVKKSSQLLGDFLGLSRYSIYNYLNECKNDEKEENNKAANT